MINKIGIIFCAYGNPSYVKPCLDSWSKLKQKYNIKIAAVHGQFKEYHDNDIIDCDIETLDELYNSVNSGIIDYLYVQNDYYVDSEWIFQTEAEIRNHGLKYLLSDNCDIIWILDLDEFYTEEQIENIIQYINQPDNLLYSWFSIPFKNYVFNEKQWISGFCPPRIFKKIFGDDDTMKLTIDSFYYDNDIKYKVNIKDLPKQFNSCDDCSYKQLGNKPIPKNIINQGIKHLTWLHSNGKQKVEYQLTHFGHSSYKWNKEKNELEFDLDFYRKNGLELPIINKDE